LCRWAILLPRQGGGRTQEAFDDKFFDWWAREIPFIEDYLSVGISFLKYPYMPMPLGEEHDEIGNVLFLKLLIF
jgi:hypothetical protein